MKRELHKTKLAIALVAGFLILGILTETASAQRGGKGRSGGSSARVQRGGSAGQGASRGRSQNRQQLSNRVRGQAKNAIQSRGRQAVANRAQANGIRKSDINGKAANRLQNTVKNRATNRAREAVQNRRQNTPQVRQQVKDRVKNHVKDHVRDHVRDRVRNNARHNVKSNVRDYVRKRAQWHWHGAYGYNKKTYVQICDRSRYLRANYRRHWTFATWKTCYPVRCHWWYNYCGPRFYFDPSCSVTYDWTCYTVPVTVINQVANPEVRWYLGMKCVLVPGKGLGIEEVTPDSPAALAGLTPGMFILAANGIVIESEASMPIAIDQSGGLLGLDVQVSEVSEVVRFDVTLQPVAVSRF